MVECGLYATGSIPIHATMDIPEKLKGLTLSWPFSKQKFHETWKFNVRGVEAIKNTTLWKLHKVSKGVRAMGSNANRIWSLSLKWRTRLG